MKKTRIKKTRIITIIAVIIAIAIALVCFKVGFNTGAKYYKKIIDYYFPSPTEQVSINGTITEIQNNVLSVETTIQNPYVLPEKWKAKIIKVTINDKTEITKFDFNISKLVEITVAELRVGDKINARADKDIKNKDEFAAKSIQLYTRPSE